MIYSNRMFLSNRSSYILLFIFSLLINFLFLNCQIAPVYFPDSNSYFSLSKVINSGKLPDLSVRTPTFPLYLSIYTLLNNIEPIIYVNLIIGAFGTLLLFWLINQLTSKTFLAFVLALFIMTDYGIINYQATILTESIAPTLILFAIFTNIKLILNKKITPTFISILLFSDFIIMFLKPTFLILPMAIKIFYLFQSIIFPQKIIKDKTKILFFTAAINVSLIFLFLIYNQYRSGKFEISSVGSINLFGLALKYDYFKNQPYYYDAPDSVRQTIKLFESQNGPNYPNGPYEMLTTLKDSNVYQDRVIFLTEVNRYIYIKNKKHFLIMTLRHFPDNFTAFRNFYSKINYQIDRTTVFQIVNKLHTDINNFKFIGFIFCTGLTLVLIKLRSKQGIVLGAITITTMLIMVSNTVFSYGEFDRLRQPIDPLLSLSVLLPLLYLKIKKSNA